MTDSQNSMRPNPAGTAAAAIPADDCAINHHELTHIIDEMARLRDLVNAAAVAFRAGDLLHDREEAQSEAGTQADHEGNDWLAASINATCPQDQFEEFAALRFGKSLKRLCGESNPEPVDDLPGGEGLWAANILRRMADERLSYIHSVLQAFHSESRRARFGAAGERMTR